MEVQIVHGYFYSSVSTAWNNIHTYSEIKRNFNRGTLMTSDIRVGKGSKIATKIGRYRVGQGR